MFEAETEELRDADVIAAPLGVAWTFVGRGASPGEVVVAEQRAGAEGATPTTMTAVDLESDDRRSLLTLPPFSWPRSMDGSGQHLLFQQNSELFRRSTADNASAVRVSTNEYLTASW